MNIYLAGPCDSEHRTLMVQVANIIRRFNNVEVYCPWELKIKNAWEKTQEEWANRVFEADIEAIQKCDIFFMISLGRISSAGTNWENGYAFALNKNITILQITEESTSLMTFSSSTNFINCSYKNLFFEVHRVMTDLMTYNGFCKNYSHICRTVLT